MSVTLELLQRVSDITASLPKGNDAVVAPVTAKIKAVTGALYQQEASAMIADNGGFIGDIIDGIVSGIKGVINEIKDKVDGVVSTVIQVVNNAVTGLTNTINGVATRIINGINDTLQGIADAVADAINWLTEKLQGVINEIHNVASTIANAIAAAISDIGDFIAGAISDALGGISDWIAGVISDVSGWISDAYNNVSKWVNGAVKDIGDWIRDTYNNIKEWFNKTLTQLKDTYETTRKTVEQFFNDAIKFINGVIADLISWWNGYMLPRFQAMFAQILKDILTASEWAQGVTGLSDEDINKILNGDLSPLSKAMSVMGGKAGDILTKSPIYAVAKAIAYMYNEISLQFLPSQVAASKWANINLALDPISMNDAANALFRGAMSKDEFLYNAKLGGVRSSLAEKSLEANRPLPTPGQVQALFLRGEIDEARHDKILSSYGFSQQYINEIKSLYAIIPSVTDIITMAVKEAFTPAIAERFGQFQDFPEIFASWAAKVGLSKEWALNYWAAHWDLPSPQMGFAMYQRRIIDRDDLTLLLKALDIMPFWREKLINLSYNPPTRVDVRRMYKMGVIDEDQVYNFHLDIGYSPENARLLTEFTKRYSAPEDQSQQDQFIELARGTYSAAYKDHIISIDEYRVFLEQLKYAPDDIALLISLDDYAVDAKERLFDDYGFRKDYVKLITNAYDRGLVNRNDAKPMLLDMGYGEDQAELELSLIDYNRELAVKDVLIQQLHNQYVGFIVDNVQLHTILDTFGFYSDEIDRLIQEWDIERSFRDKRPSLTDLRRFLNKDLITLDEFLDELRGIGYNEKYIDFYRQDLQTAIG